MFELIKRGLDRVAGKIRKRPSGADLSWQLDSAGRPGQVKRELHELFHFTTLLVKPPKKRKKEVIEDMSSMRLDDLWFAGFLVAAGARLKRVAVLPYNNGRQQAFFELEEVPASAVEEYAESDPKVGVHALHGALNDLREAMRKALDARNGNGNGGGSHNQNNRQSQPKPTPTRRVDHEQNTPRGNRCD